MKKIPAIVVCICLVYFVSAQPASKKISAYDNKFTMLIPSDVKLMTPEQIQIKYHKSPDNKTSFYSDEDADFSIVLSVIRENVEEADLVANKDRLTSQVEAKGYTLEENEIKKVKKHNLVVISFYSDVPGGKIFNKRFYAVVDGKLIMAVFNCTESVQEKWKPAIDMSINSVEIK